MAQKIELVKKNGPKTILFLYKAHILIFRKISFIKANIIKLFYTFCLETKGTQKFYPQGYSQSSKVYSRN
ncbi:hypothetical protein PM10SUCC1_22130 [Propionigenium maris DSM 9537]|uniref:Uncharacterized protein n=1 Tax=Propionigenium maris DSM 9537 TaxID=1123000 RepID=A0A9W6GMT1_9FUSO|nr:hypothetical protein PM10SUCC1_22130 [Propionigenium maris DSM 9537]